MGHQKPPLAHGVAGAVPPAQYEPRAHAPPHAADPHPVPMPTTPGGHAAAVAFVDPAPHQYPDAHGPVQFTTVCAVVVPYRPAAQSPEQDEVYRPVTAPKRPSGHAAAVDDVDAGTQ